MTEFYNRARLVLKNNSPLLGAILALLGVAFLLLYLAGVKSLHGHSATLHTCAQLLVSILVVPLVLKLWFWSGIHASLLDTLAVHRTLHGLGILATHPDPDHDWSRIVSVESGAKFVLIAVAGQPLATEALRQRLVELSKVKGAEITICVRHPATLTSSFAPDLLSGQVVWLKDFIRTSLTPSKHAKCQIRLGCVRFDLKYTLVLGSNLGVYIPHPANQQNDKSATLMRLVFDRKGEFYQRFLQQDVAFILSKMKDLP